MNSIFYMLLFSLGVFASSCSQILLKKSANKDLHGLKIYLNAEVIVGYSIFFAVAAFAVYLLRYIELTTAVLLESLGYVFVPVLSRAFFKETPNKKQFLGMSLILLGVILYTLQVVEGN